MKLNSATYQVSDEGLDSLTTFREGLSGALNQDPRCFRSTVLELGGKSLITSLDSLPQPQMTGWG